MDKLNYYTCCPVSIGIRMPGALWICIFFGVIGFRIRLLRIGRARARGRAGVTVGSTADARITAGAILTVGVHANA